MVWCTLLVVAVCLPMALVSALVGEAYWPKLDGLTMAMPSGVRTTVAAIAMNRVGVDRSSSLMLQRVLKLDPANGAGLSRNCQDQAGTGVPQAVATCRAAIARVASAANYNSLGQAQDKAKDFCSAEESYTVANNFVHSGNAFYLREMGISAYRCGRVAYSVAELGAAESLDEKDSVNLDQDDDELGESRRDLQADREWLAVSYAADKMPKQAAESCQKAHPDWKACGCVFGEGEAVCTEPGGGGR